MKTFNVLGTIMFIMAPFSLFCSDDGNGIVLCVMCNVFDFRCFMYMGWKRRLEFNHCGNKKKCLGNKV